MSLPSATTPACTQVTVFGLTLYIPDSTNSDLQYLAYLQIILMTLLITIFSLLFSVIFCLGGMTYTPFDTDDDTHRPDLWGRTPLYAPTPGYYLDRESIPSVCPSPSPDEILNERSSPLHQPQTREVGFLPVVEHEDGGTWDGQSTNCIHYQIEWRVTLNNRVVTKDTEQNLALPPSSYWEKINEKAAGLLRRKIARDRRVRPDDTTIVVSVKDRSQRDLTKRFESTDIDWTTVEKQLLAWAHLYHLGKKLLLQISINYIEDSGALLSGSDKRGKSSTSKRRLADRDARIDAEQSSGQYPVWRDVYRVMRCPGPPCRHEGQYCWQDPEGKKHYRLKTHHMKALIKYVEQGGDLETHDDIPDSVREQLYAEENQRFEKKKKCSDNSTIGSICPPININNFLPAGSSQQLMPSPVANEASRAMSACAEPIIVHGLLDVAVGEYTEWQQSRVSNEAFRDNITKARDVTLENCLDLMQVYEDQDPDFFVKRGVKVGAARRFVRDIGRWVNRRGENTRQETIIN
ncbi:hypothetical protein PENNAL_c0256G06018 [Penicillium nalgiovense]|uniref:Uncharacterized protein n=2 Tax=Penicillium nalgiovense TaxID=60175 RepID=A0A1V6WJG9_PENNA|nr:hypothetical protein PENNAL_c0256G06018 [Penicillium nalgiovense]